MPAAGRLTAQLACRQSYSGTLDGANSAVLSHLISQKIQRGSGWYGLRWELQLFELAE